MAWRFKASKFKNAAPIVPKFEQHIRDLSIGCYRSQGNCIASSAAFMAFNWEINGSSVAVLPLETKGRQNKGAIPLIYAHSEFITDFQFSPFDDGLLATGSQDLTIKLWRIPETGVTKSGLSTAELTLPEQPRRVETINFHPNADYILASSAGNSVSVWDLVTAQDLYVFANHGDVVQSVSWQQNGKLLATQSKDRKLRILDPRTPSNNLECESHQGIKDSRVVWIGDSDRVLTTGYSAERLREINIRDIRNLSQPQKNLSLDMSSGILVPLFDNDTNMCFLCGKGDRNIQFIEITDSEPFIVEGLKYSGDQSKGTCLVPKRAMDVMQGEVNRVLQLCDSSIVPIMWQVPRKSYRDYHADIFPETYGLTAGLRSKDWWSGQNCEPSKLNLDPKKRPKESLVVFQEVQDRARLMEEKSNGGSNGTSHCISEQTSVDKKKEDDGKAIEFKSPFVKPCPKPRAVARSNSSSSSESPRKKPTPPTKPATPPKLEPDSPTPRPRNTSCQNAAEATVPLTAGSGEDALDDGLAMLRRQPSIRDRKKLLEENLKRTQSVNVKRVTDVPVQVKKRIPSDEDNKENKIVKAPVVVKDRSDGVDFRRKNMFLANDKKEEESRNAPVKRPVSKVFGRISKFKHLKGDIILQGRFENLKNLSKTCPAECNFVHANADRIAVPLTDPGGKIAIFETRKPGRIPDGVTPVLINGTTVMDFGFDPFDKARLAVACDDGGVRLWRVPEGGLVQQMNKPEMEFSAHADKIQILQFHPLAKDVLLTAAFDRTVKIWDLNHTAAAKMELEGHNDQLYSAKFSQCGQFVATVCRDGKVRIFDPRSGPAPIVENAEGDDIVPKKGARVVWVLNDEYLVVTAFSRQSERQVMVYRSKDLKLMNTVVLDVSPAIMIPHYDEDSNTLFLTGKGESTVTTLEVSTDSPYLFPLSPYKPAGLHQGFAFLQKQVCDVRKVEFARAFRLTEKTIEPISFTVPRVKTTYFQDDLFPETRVLWKPSMSAEEWLSGSNKSAALLNLKPEDMAALTSVNATDPSSVSSSAASSRQNSMHTIPSIPEQTFQGQNSFARELAKKKEADIESSVSIIVGEVNEKLEQDDMEGVEEKEWNED